MLTNITHSRGIVPSGRVPYPLHRSHRTSSTCHSVQTTKRHESTARTARPAAARSSPPPRVRATCPPRLRGAWSARARGRTRSLAAGALRRLSSAPTEVERQRATTIETRRSGAETRRRSWACAVERHRQRSRSCGSQRVGLGFLLPTSCEVEAEGEMWRCCGGAGVQLLQR